MQGETKFYLRRKFFRFLGAEMKVLDENGNMKVFAQAKRLKLKEELTLYQDEQKTIPLVSIKAQQILDLSPTYDIKDPETGQILGALKRKGLSSTFIQDSWEILDPQGQTIGTIQEDTTGLGLLRRWVGIVSLVVPQKYHVTIHGNQIGNFQRSINLFLIKYDISFDTEYLQSTDWRVVLSYPIVLSLIEDSKQ